MLFRTSLDTLKDLYLNRLTKEELNSLDSCIGLIQSAYFNLDTASEFIELDTKSIEIIESLDPNMISITNHHTVDQSSLMSFVIVHYMNPTYIRLKSLDITMNHIIDLDQLAEFILICGNACRSVGVTINEMFEVAGVLSSYGIPTTGIGKHILKVLNITPKK